MTFKKHRTLQNQHTVCRLGNCELQVQDKHIQYVIHAVWSLLLIMISNSSGVHVYRCFFQVLLYIVFVSLALMLLVACVFQTLVHCLHSAHCA